MITNHISQHLTSIFTVKPSLLPSDENTMESSGPNEPKLVRKGAMLYNEGDPATHVYVVQSGLISVTLKHGAKSFQIAQVVAPQIAGEEALWGAQNWSASAIAVNDTRVLEIPVAQAKQILGSVSPVLKLLSSGMLEKQRHLTQEMELMQLEADTTPCPPGCITKLFAVIHRVVEYTGTKKGDAAVVVWPSFKKYCQRVFLESPVRLEQAVNILVKLGCARLEMVKSETDPDAPDELGFVHFTDLELIKGFADFYRQHYYAGTLAESFSNTEADPALSSYLQILTEIEQWNATGKVELPIPEEKAA